MDISKLPEKYAKWYDESYCYELMLTSPQFFNYVKIQTEEICLAAVKIYSANIQFVHQQTYKIICQALEKCVLYDDIEEILEYVDFSVLTDEQYEEIVLKYMVG